MEKRWEKMWIEGNSAMANGCGEKRTRDERCNVFLPLLYRGAKYGFIEKPIKFLVAVFERGYLGGYLSDFMGIR